MSDEAERDWKKWRERLLTIDGIGRVRKTALLDRALQEAEARGAARERESVPELVRKHVEDCAEFCEGYRHLSSDPEYNERLTTEAETLRAWLARVRPEAAG